MIEQERYAVVSCHVEKLLDERAWRLFSALQKQAPSGFRIAALLRPPDESIGEAEEQWVERAREVAMKGPIGHHIHWGGAKQARPILGEPEDRLRAEGAWLKVSGLRPTLFCGGGWYIDARVAEVTADLGYVDCTATAFRPAYLAATEPHLHLSRPCWLELPSGRRLLELPTTHSIGMLARAAFRRRALDEPLVHLYFHDTDLLDRRRRAALLGSLTLLARRRVPTDLDRVANEACAAELALQRF